MPTLSPFYVHYLCGKYAVRLVDENAFSFFVLSTFRHRSLMDS